MSQFYKKESIDKLLTNVNDIIQGIIDEAKDGFPHKTLSQLTKASSKLQDALDGAIKVVEKE